MTTTSWDTIVGGGVEETGAALVHELGRLREQVQELLRVADEARDALRAHDSAYAIELLDRVVGAAPQIKPRAEIEALKENWLSDPCWDIEDTEGFEAHYGELYAFRLAQENGHMKARIAGQRCVLQAFKRLMESV